MATHGYDLRNTPLVLQFNKRDLPSALPFAALDELFSTVECPRFEAVAPVGQGVFDTLKAIAKAILAPHRAKAGESTSG